MLVLVLLSSSTHLSGQATYCTIKASLSSPKAPTERLQHTANEIEIIKVPRVLSCVNRRFHAISKPVLNQLDPTGLCPRCRIIGHTIDCLDMLKCFQLKMIDCTYP